MNTNVKRIKRYIRRMEAMVLAVLIIATSLSYTVSAAENNTEQEQSVELEEESEQQNLVPVENNKIDNIELEEIEENLELENELEKEEVSLYEGELEQEEVSQQENEIKEILQQDSEIEEAFNQENEIEGVAEIVNEAETPYVEYSLQTDVDGYKIRLEAYEGVFPEGEELSLFAMQIEDQDILNEIDSQLSGVCEGEFKQTSFDIKVLNAAGEELQPDRSKYIENEDIIPIQLSIEFANDEIEGEMEVFHFADDLSSMECLVSTVDGDEITVEPEHFSVFTILQTNHGSYYSGLTAPTGYRTYIEWMPNSTAGLRRLQKIYVYAKEGEIISFGSSSFLNLSKDEVTQSLKDSFGYGVGIAPSSASIAVTLPYSADAMQENNVKDYYKIYSSADPTVVVSEIEKPKTYGDNNIYLFQKEEISNVNTSENISAQGTIYNWQQEALGAKNDNNPGGYNPISFKAPVSGVYTFRFFGTQYTKVVAATKVKKTDAFLQKSNNYVGAWDITVTKSATETTPVKGRTFTDALIWTIGANLGDGESVLNESVYALTKDGFEYKVDFNGIDPFGFVFFTNKRGLLVSSDDHEDGKYRSLARSVRSARNQLDDLIEMGVHINSTPTTDKDESYFLTFDKADSALLNHYTKHSSLTGKDDIGTNSSAYDEFKFRGLNSTDNHGIEGYGGYFSFKYNSSAEESGKILPSTYEIIMDFTGNATLESEYGYAPGTPNEVILSNTLVDGSNTIFWDGKDEHGNIVIGDAAGIDYTIVSFNVKAGEVHFPLLDVENNRNGIKVEMQNDLPDVDKSKIYYDNSDSDVYGKNIGDKAEALSGALSSSGAMVFKKNSGDCCAIDIWADYKVATPVEKYKFTLTGIANDQAFLEAKTAWEYYYVTMDGKKHYDATPAASLPKEADVVLQYRIVDKDTVNVGGIDQSSDNWQVADTGDDKDWKNYEGDVKVSLEVKDAPVNVKNIVLAPSNTSAPSFDKSSTDGTYKSVKIESYYIEANTDPATKEHYPIDASEGMCVFSGLPLHPTGTDGQPDSTKFYQYRVVDKRVINKSLLDGYDTEEIFDRDAAVDIQVTAGHVTKYVYLEEVLDYKYRGAPTFNLEFDQLWNDDPSMTSEWRAAHRPKAVKVAVLYGIPLYEDVDESTEYDITTEKGYYGEDVDIVWRKIQLIDYLTIDKDGVSCTDSKGVTRTLSSLSVPDGPYAAYFPVGKYMSNGDPYFYKIRPVAYSMDGINFTDVEYWDAGHMIPKTSLPEFYGVDDDADDTENKKFHVVFYDEDVAGTNVLYPNAVKFTDVPEKAEIEVTKRDEANNPITGKATSYEIKNKVGKSLMFTCDSEGKYTYKGLEDDPSLPTEASKIIKTSTVDSKVHADGLPLHEYSVHEVEAPKGYALSSTSIDIIVPDFMSSSSTVDGFKIYLCQRDQKDSKLPIPSPEPTDPPSKSDDIDGTDVNEDALVTNTSSVNANKDIAADKLPKTGGLMGSLMAMILGIFMIGSGIYLIKPSKKQRNNRD